MTPPKTRRERATKALLLTLFGLSVYLAVEAFQPADRQPTARLCRAAIDAYRSRGSPVAKATGISCKFTPTCSQYARDAVEGYGTVGGLSKALGRLFRCSPWGGGGYDPAVPGR